MKMLKILGKAVKLYTVIDTVLGVVALGDYYLATKGWKIDRDKVTYPCDPFTKFYLNGFDRKARKFGLIIDDTKDEEDCLDILNTVTGNTLEA